MGSRVCMSDVAVVAACGGDESVRGAPRSVVFDVVVPGHTVVFSGHRRASHKHLQFCKSVHQRFWHHVARESPHQGRHCLHFFYRDDISKTFCDRQTEFQPWSLLSRLLIPYSVFVTLQENPSTHAEVLQRQSQAVTAIRIGIALLNRSPAPLLVSWECGD